MKTHVLGVHFYEKKQDGTKYTYISKKDGKEKSYKKVKLDLPDGKSAWGAAFSATQENVMKGWNPDHEIELEITETQKDGKTYLNFNIPKSVAPGVATTAQLSQLVTRIEELEAFMHEVKSGKKSWGSGYSEVKDLLEGVGEDQIPFN